MTTKYHLFQKYRHNNYNYVDNVTKTYIEMGGCLINIYPLLGVIKNDGTMVSIDSTNESMVGDVVLNENSKRKYSHTTYDLWATTTMNPPNFSWSYAGISILDGDVKEFSLHYNSMIAVLGRKIIVGDVIELTWQRDLDVLGSDKAQNKFYVVTESLRDEQGWGPEWHYHLWKIKCKPIMNSPEFADLFNNDNTTGGEDGFYVDPGDINGGGGLDESMTQDDKLQDQVDEILKEAEGEDGSEENGWTTSGVSYRLYDEHHVFLAINDKFYITDGSHIQNRENIVGIDGIPAESTCEEVKYGDYFPKDAREDEYFLRIDYMPPKLYKRVVKKQTEDIVNIQYGDVKLTEAKLNLNGNGFDGSIINNDIIVGSINKGKVYVNETYIGVVTDSGKIINTRGEIIGQIEQKVLSEKKGWALQEFDRRERWTGVPFRLRRTVNNEETFTNEEGDIEPMRQNIKDLVKPRVKKEHYNPRPWNKDLQQQIEDDTYITHKIIGMDYSGEE